MYRELLAILLAVGKGILHQSVILQSFVLHAISHITVEEEPLVEGGRGRAADAVTHALQTVVVDGRVHRSELKQVLAGIGMGGYVAIEHDGKETHGVTERRHLVESFHKRLGGVGITACCLQRAVFLPKSIRLVARAVQTDDGRTLVEVFHLVGRRSIERVIGVDVKAARIHSLGTLCKLEVDGDVVLCDESRAIGRAHEVLLYAELRHIVEVNLLGHV